eukprot:COSAG01_NODE_27723_length_678_cov_1.740933_1_plen_24_part_01
MAEEDAINPALLMQLGAEAEMDET